MFVCLCVFFSSGKPNLASTVASLWYFNPDIPEALPYKHLWASLFFCCLISNICFVNYLYHITFIISYKDVPVEIHQLPPSTNAQTIDQQLKEHRKTIKEILCMDPDQYKVCQQWSPPLFYHITFDSVFCQTLNNTYWFLLLILKK